MISLVPPGRLEVLACALVSLFTMGLNPAAQAAAHPPAASPSPSNTSVASPSVASPSAANTPVANTPVANTPVANTPAANIPAEMAPDPRTPGSYLTSMTVIDDGCDYDLDAAPPISWTDPAFGYTDPLQIAFGDSDNGQTDNRCPGTPARMVDMKVRVWYPGQNGAVAPGGPYPLVVMLHGQQIYSIPGYEGYDYLGQLLASHGFMVASIDGRSMLDATIKSRGEHIREHLRRFVTRNAAGSGSFLSGQLDLSRVIVVGHSRGGDAIVAAWEWQRVAPDPGYGIGGLVAIAPVQFFGTTASEPSFTSHVRDVPYQILHGSKDGDVADFQGLRQYDRAADPRDPGETLKSMVFVKDANHNFFNTVWQQLEGNDYCCGGTLTGPLSQDIARVYLHSFVEVVLRDDARYLEYLINPAANPVSGTTVALDYQAPDPAVVVDHHESLEGEVHNPTTNSIDGVVSVTPRSSAVQYAERLLAASERSPWNSYKGETWGSSLAWTSSVSYLTEVTEDASLWIDPASDHLSFRVGQVFRSRGQNPSGQNQDLEVRLIDAAGESSPWVPVSGYAPIFPPWQTAEGGIKTVMGGVRIPVSAFTSIDATALHQIEFRFQVQATGELVFDDIRFSR